MTGQLLEGSPPATRWRRSTCARQRSRRSTRRLSERLALAVEVAPPGRAWSGPPSTRRALGLPRAGRYWADGLAVPAFEAPGARGRARLAAGPGPGRAERDGPVPRSASTAPPPCWSITIRGRPRRGPRRLGARTAARRAADRRRRLARATSGACWRRGRRRRRSPSEDARGRSTARARCAWSGSRRASTAAAAERSAGPAPRVAVPRRLRPPAQRGGRRPSGTRDHARPSRRGARATLEIVGDAPPVAVRRAGGRRRRR